MFWKKKSSSKENGTKKSMMVDGCYNYDAGIVKDLASAKKHHVVPIQYEDDSEIVKTMKEHKPFKRE